MKLTFPIREADLRKRGLKAILRSVMTWLAPLPAIGAFTVRDTAPFMYVPMVLVTVGLFAFHWRKKLKQLRPRWIEQAVKESNNEQDVMIRNQVLHFQRQGANWEGQQLQRALQSKQAIENQLFLKQPKIALWARMETLVDTLIFSLIEKLEIHRRIGGLKSEAEIEEAIYQLQETEHNLGDIIAPHLSDDDQFLPSEDKLSTALRELKEEREIAQRVKRRLEQGFSEGIYSSNVGEAQ